MTIKVYEYKNCSTCRKALKYLDDRGVSYERISIIEQPPSKTELKQMLAHVKAAGGNLKSLFNTSGQQYRDLKIAESLKSGMTEAEAIDQLVHNGKLIKRPFLLSAKGGCVGFKPEAWDEIIS